MAGLTGKVAVVTGAGSGLGASTALHLASIGARVCCADRNEAAAQSIAGEIVAAAGDAFPFTIDVTDPEENEAMAAATVARFGALHIAFLNAGVISYGSVLDMPIEEWDRVLNVNLRGVYLGLQACGRRIAEAGGGSIVLTSSSAGLLGAPQAPAYAASKHGVLGLMKSAAADLAPFGIRVNAVCPGVIDTPLLGPLHGQTDMLKSLLGPAHPIGRVGTASEVAAVVAFLVSDDSSFMTGASVAVDGGVTSILMSMGTARDEVAQG